MLIPNANHQYESYIVCPVVRHMKRGSPKKVTLRPHRHRNNVNLWHIIVVNKFFEVFVLYYNFLNNSFIHHYIYLISIGGFALEDCIKRLQLFRNELSTYLNATTESHSDICADENIIDFELVPDVELTLWISSPEEIQQMLSK